MESLCVLVVVSLQITRNTESEHLMRVRYVCIEKKEHRANLIVPLHIAEEVKYVPSILVDTGKRTFEGNRDDYNVIKVYLSRGKSLPNMATRLRKLSPQELCSEVR